MKKIAHSYVRFSSDKQQHGSSLERQDTRVADWLRAHPDYELSSFQFRDLGRSGFHAEHLEEGGGMAKLLAAIKAGHIQAGEVVLLEHIDRAGRLPMWDMEEQIIRPILRAGVKLHTLHDGVTYDESAQFNGQALLLSVQLQQAHQYSKNLQRMVKAAYVKRIKAARDGKATVRNTPIWLTTSGEIIPHIAEHVREAFTLYVSGVGKNAIARRLRLSGVAELAKCSGPTVEGWLRNTAAIGHWTYNGDNPELEGTDIPDAYPPIIDKELFFRAQKQKEKAKTQAHRRTSKHLLVGLVKCADCGGNFIIQNKDGVPHSLRCLSRQRLREALCTNTKCIPKGVFDYVRRQTQSAFIQQARREQNLSKSQKRVIEIRGELETLGAQARRLTKALMAVDDMPELLEQLGDVKSKQDALQAELLVQERTVDAPSPIREKSLVKELSVTLESDPEKMNALLKGVGYTITVAPDGSITHGERKWTYQGIDRRTGNLKLWSEADQKAVMLTRDGYAAKQ
ncbi:recombinase family protein [Pseudomonas sp. JM0905a]|uniref:recombinase family protein n=1 Tax=Pseudomonas sp. JM0905a TaxID=2772484 RepID=UPI0016859123|nr:recombinase family protein [Pseudomonas sp. JM0905a]MBD2840060.1 recombinase family protein [Pseudomonas sp. JM0905a]